MSEAKTWFRFYTETLFSAKLQSQSGDRFKSVVNCWCSAARHGGKLPDLKTLSFELRMSEQSAKRLVESLAADNLLDCNDGVYVPHDWGKWQYDSDVSTDRVRRFRGVTKAVPGTTTKRFRSVSETPPETETETEQITPTPFSDYGCDDLVQELYATWPQKRRGGRPVIEELVVRKVSESVDPQATIQTIRTSAKNYLAQLDGDTFCFGLKRWLEEDEWTNQSTPAYSGPDPRMIL